MFCSVLHVFHSCKFVRDAVKWPFFGVLVLNAADQDMLRRTFSVTFLPKTIKLVLICVKVT